MRPALVLALLASSLLLVAAAPAASAQPVLCNPEPGYNSLPFDAQAHGGQVRVFIGTLESRGVWWGNWYDTLC